MRLSERQKREYEESGYTIARQSIDYGAIDLLLSKYLGLVEQISGRRFTDAQSPALAEFMNENKPIQTQVYDEIRRPPWVHELCLASALVDPVRTLLGERVGLFRKVPFRIDAPLETAQFAVWHQDYFYVLGNTDVVTAWVPLQDTTYLNGCLALMPGSHKLGPIEHDMTVLGKRHFPSNVFDREVRYAEVRKGDVVLFHSCMLHSSGLNLSTSIRYSLQARYTRLGEPVHPGMGGVIPVGHAVGQ